MIQTFNEQTLVPGPFVTLKCSAVGNPAPDITWLLDRQPITFQQQPQISSGARYKYEFKIIRTDQIVICPFIYIE